MVEEEKKIPKPCVRKSADPIYYADLKERAKELRNRSTAAERLVWDYLKGKKFHGLKIRRQHIIGQYIADFACLEKKLVIEIDGGYHFTEEQIEEDETRTYYLRQEGYSVIRFTNDQIFNNIHQVMQEIKSYIDHTSSPSNEPEGHTSSPSNEPEGHTSSPFRGRGGLCLILAAGYATRLYPLTENFPKPLLKVGEKTILDWLVDDIAASGKIDEFIVISNHKFAHHFEKWALEKKVNALNSNSPFRGFRGLVVDDGTSTNETRLGAVKDIQFAIDKLGIDDDMLVIAGDNVLDFSLQHFLDYAISKGTSCIMRYYEPDDAKLRKCGVVTIDDDDRILRMAEKPEYPESHWCCPPFYYYKKEDARLIPQAIAAGCGTDAPGSFIAWLAQHSPVHAMPMPGRRYDIGNLASYEQVQKEYQGIIK